MVVRRGSDRSTRGGHYKAVTAAGRRLRRGDPHCKKVVLPGADRGGVVAVWRWCTVDGCGTTAITARRQSRRAVVAARLWLRRDDSHGKAAVMAGDGVAGVARPGSRGGGWVWWGRDHWWVVGVGTLEW
ncbi:hypothetical protein [Dactylosporangium maewongense]|uniref:hypothetical protein n=1 Tax=Dactylosporangium maewongense TaxID=634393 RepID=UPI0031D4A83D